MRIRALLLAPTVALLLGACASTGATFNSGVGDAFPDEAPWYAGARTTPVAAAGTRVGILPVLYQRGATQSEIFDPKATTDSPMGTLLRDMNAYLDSLTAANGTVPVRLDAAPVSVAGAVAPDVRFGCMTEDNLPDGDCATPGGALGRRNQRMHLAVGRPSAPWTAGAASAMATANVSHAIVLTLEVGQFLPRQSGLLGDKSIELGTKHIVPLPWLTSLETPVAVLQVTGALIGRDGKAVRIGAEGLLAKRTRLLVSAIAAQELLTNEDLEAMRTRRRTELPGQPLVWQQALKDLVSQLTK